MELDEILGDCSRIEILQPSLCVLLQALMGLPMSAASLQIGMPVGFQSMAPMLSGFQQMWATAAGQQYPGGLMTAGQLQELYGGMNGIEAPPPAHSQLPSAGGDAQASSLYR
jgi:hypothetical protein